MRPNNDKPKEQKSKKLWTIRRLDERNFAVCHIGDDGKQEIGGYYSDIKSACLAMLRDGISGKDTKELLKSVQDAEKRVIEAIGRFPGELSKPTIAEEQAKARRKKEDGDGR